MKLLGSQKGWSLPLTWILVLAIALAILLAYRFSWWWLAVPAAVYIAIAITSVVVRRKNIEQDKLFRLLVIPLYGLNHIKSIEESSEGGYSYDIVPKFTENYTPEQQSQITDAMETAIADSDIDLTKVMPNLPFDNDQIRTHLKETLKRIRALSS
jgi:hypothetical protein